PCLPRVAAPEDGRTPMPSGNSRVQSQGFVFARRTSATRRTARWPRREVENNFKCFAGSCIYTPVKRLLHYALLSAVTFAPLHLQAAPKTDARLLLDHRTARPGDTVLAGVHLRMAPKWHTYWRYPGDSGAATKIAWTLPPGVIAGEPQ